MKYIKTTICLLLLLATVGCSDNFLFSGDRREEFPVTRITESRTRTVQLLNNSPDAVQHITNIAFYGDSNKAGHFQVSEVVVGSEEASKSDIFIPPLGVLNLTITYAPLDYETTPASFSGWVTTSDDKWEGDEKPVVEAKAKVEGGGTGDPRVKPEDDMRGKDDMRGEKVMPANTAAVILSGAKDLPLTGDSSSASPTQNDIRTEADPQDNTRVNYDDYPAAIHRAMLIVAYDSPKEGYVNIELVGGAVPGPDGEIAAVGVGGISDSECVASGSRACFFGTFSIELPSLMSSGPMEVPMPGAIPFTIEGGAAELNMDEFPPVLIVLKGNGPGDPLEGQPIDTLSIIVSGTPETSATGSFDGTTLSMTDASFRIRVLLGETTYEDINPGLAAAVDFNITGLEVVTEEPFDGSKIVFGVETTLSATPSNNSLFDSVLGNAQVIVKFSGMLELP